MKKKIGILGSGIVGQTLANGFIKHGYEVMMGSGNPDKYKELKEKTNGKAAAGSFAETAEYADIIVLAVKGNAALKVLESSGLNNLKGKTIIDSTNPIADSPPVNGVLKFFTDPDESLMELLQKSFPESDFVKCFSCVGNALMVNPDLNGVKPSMFICGNSDPAKSGVRTILTEFGWETEDMGKAEAARAIEPLCILWCIPGFINNDWMHAFKLLRKTE